MTPELLKKIKEALEFYGNPERYFQRTEYLNLKHTTAVLHTDKPEELSEDFETKVFDCSASIKVNQGKKARDVLEDPYFQELFKLGKTISATNNKSLKECLDALWSDYLERKDKQ